jgi:hypothetical protein
MLFNHLKWIGRLGSLFMTTTQYHPMKSQRDFNQFKKANHEHREDIYFSFESEKPGKFCANVSMTPSSAAADVDLVKSFFKNIFSDSSKR